MGSIRRECLDRVIPLGEQHEQAHGAPYYHLHRADLHELLAAKVLELARTYDDDAITHLLTPLIAPVT